MNGEAMNRALRISSRPPWVWSLSWSPAHLAAGGSGTDSAEAEAAYRNGVSGSHDPTEGDVECRADPAASGDGVRDGETDEDCPGPHAHLRAGDECRNDFGRSFAR
jgi:hypothetical protein